MVTPENINEAQLNNYSVTENDKERLQKAALEYFGNKTNLDGWELDDMYEG